LFNGAISWLFKIALQMVFWVFLLSIRWDGRTLFDRAHEILVDNSVVAEVDREASRIWARFQASVGEAIRSSKTTEDSMTWPSKG
jgi:hypothetical protein